MCTSSNNLQSVKYQSFWDLFRGHKKFITVHSVVQHLYILYIYTSSNNLQSVKYQSFPYISTVKYTAKQVYISLSFNK